MSGLKLHLDEWGRLVLTDAEGRQHVGVEAVRGFPISDPRYGIALVDPGGREHLWIESLDHLPESERSLLEEELSRREFLPILRRVLRVSGIAEPTVWHAETDRGSVRFTLSSEDDVRRLNGGQAMIIDSHGIRYLIRDVDALDATTRRILERYL
jgi:hypothetical protein